MTADSGAADDIHIYRIKPGLIFLNIFILGIFALLLGTPLAPLVFAMRMLYQPDTDYAMLSIGVLCMFAPMLVLVLLLILLQVAMLVFSIFSSLKVTPYGIEQKNWPFQQIRSHWSELDRLGKFLFYDALYLQNYAITGLSLSHRPPLKYFNFNEPFISLFSYRGWPNGPLADDLKRYAPALFEQQQAAQPLAAPDPAEGAGISSQERQLAALAHAAILFLGLGFFIPLVIYFVQKQKSAYVAFQAMQAFILQLIGSLLGLIFPFCLLGALVIPALGVIFSLGEQSFEVSFVAFLVFLAILVNLFVFGGLALTLYGTVGAVRAYRGKDFRYALIGKLLAKRMPSQ